jgi:2,3-bisphosphoglycerate-independent phosphoglycerate mutase
MRRENHVHIFFLDGVGLGPDDAQTNPFVRAQLPHLSGLLGSGWFVKPENGRVSRKITERASLVATDPNMGVPGRPQSATGQATILTGRNVPALVGQHFGPKPSPAVAAILRQGNLFQDVVGAGGSAALITPYPERYFEAINSGKRLLSSVPLAAVSAGLELMTVDDLRVGNAVSPGFTGQAWLDLLGYQDIPVLSLAEAGQRIASISKRYHFSFFEHWPSDRSGHRGSLEQAMEHLENIDEVVGGLVGGWDHERDLLIITSDHGNIEEKDHRQHSRNPVPTILIGRDHERLAQQIEILADIAPVVRSFLGLEQAPTEQAL